MFDFIKLISFGLFIGLSYVVYILIIQRYTYYQLNVPRVKTIRKGFLGYLFGESGLLTEMEGRHEVIDRWRKETNSDIFAINVLFRPLVLVFDKDLIHLLYTEPYFHKTYELRVILKDLADGLLLQEDEEHKAARGLYLPVFNFLNIKEMFPVFIEKAYELVEIISTKPVDYPIVNDIQKCTLDIISLVAFNYDMKSMHTESKVSIAFDNILMKSAFTPFFLFKLVFPVLSLLPISKNISKSDLDVVHNCIDDVIQNGIKNRKNNNDLLSKILQSVNKESINLTDLRKQVITFLSAGHGSFID